MTNTAGTNGADARRIALDQVRIEAPCPMKWADLEGDERKRYCDSCSLHVVNLSAMTRDEGQTFLDDNVAAERVCVTYSKRPDGSLVTLERPSVVDRLGRLRRVAQLAASFLIGAFPLLASCRPAAKLGGLSCPPPKPVEGEAPAAHPDVDGGNAEWLGEVALPEPEPLPEMGDVMVGRLAAPNTAPDVEPPLDSDGE